MGWRDADKVILLREMKVLATVFTEEVLKDIILPTPSQAVSNKTGFSCTLGEYNSEERMFSLFKKHGESRDFVEVLDSANIFYPDAVSAGMLEKKDSNWFRITDLGLIYFLSKSERMSLLKQKERIK